MNQPLSELPQSLQDLLPKWAHFCLYTEKFITHELNVTLEGSHLLVGVSGGIDSTALLLVLHYLSSRKNFCVTAVHINHNLRPEAAEDALWIEELCNSIGINCILESVDVSALSEKLSIGIEEAGRHARYGLFQELLSKKSADFIVLGHHLDDLSEDVLMRLARGTGWPGLAGMPGYDPKRSLIRPFLLLPKSTLNSFLSSLGVNWREDATNADPTWTRNRIRNEVLPLFLKENPNFRESIGRLWKIGQIEQDYWATMTSTTSQDINNTVLKSTHKAVRLRLYKATLDALGVGQTLAHTLFKLDDAWVEGRVGSIFQFPGDKTATITSSGVVFSSKH